MEHFVRIVMEKQESINRLDESVFPRQEIYETNTGGGESYNPGANPVALDGDGSNYGGGSVYIELLNAD
jgi:hypothetical protein